MGVYCYPSWIDIICPAYVSKVTFNDKILSLDCTEKHLARDIFFTGAQPKAGTGLRMQMVRFFNVTLLGIYRWLRYIAGSLKSYPPFWKERGMEDSQEKDYSFLGNDTFPNIYDALVYERKFKSEYLERQIYERSLRVNLP